MTRKPAFWITLALLGLAGAAAAVRFFPSAFPLLAVDVEMDRAAALAQAEALAERFDWGPPEARQAASFGQVDPAFQTYMELEGGGLGELNRLMEEGEVSLYQWRVRRFAQGVVQEAEVRFTASGSPYGFNLRLPEELAGNNISTDQARALAVTGAAADWAVDSASYELLESSEEEQIGGRVDHTFVFQRVDLSLGEATLRLRLRVAGDQLVEVTRFAHVPDAFLRRYQDTREANDSIALAGSVAFALLFLLLGGGAGTIYLIRERLVAWRAPLAWAAVIAGLMALNSINSLPLAWMGYDTALSPALFLAVTILAAIGTFLAGTGFLAFVFLAGEGLLRQGFPEQIQQWRMWSPGVSNSTQALGRTAAPYLVLGLELGYVVVFYTFMTRWAGWWSPASSLVEPDLLATPLPWLTAVSNSLFAAFSEESLFRAIPIGAAAILGRRYGKFRLWVGGAIILQAVVFAASHANYPQQPPYARLVEIFPLYVGWGIACTYFGLIPSIIGHFLYDLSLFSMPLFAARTSGIWISRLIVVGVGLAPLAVILISRARRGSVSAVPDWALNRNWTRGEPEEKRTFERVPLGERPSTLPAWGLPTIGALAVAGIVVWITQLDTRAGPRFTVTRPQAIEAARETLASEGFQLNDDWQPLVSLSIPDGAARRFVWDSGTVEQYREVLGRFLPQPALEVRFVRFDVAPEERAETWAVRVGPSGAITSVLHTLPEARPGATLTEGAARTLALEALQTRLATDPRDVREISAEETARPNRADWAFTFVDTVHYPLREGEGRLEVRIAGDEVVAAGRSVHVPEDWQRDWRRRQSRELLTMIPPAGLLGILALAAAIFAIVLWARGSLRTRPLVWLTVSVGILTLVTAINEWPREIGTFTTLTSLGNQTAVVILGVFLGTLLVAGGAGLLGALGHTWIGEARGSLAWAPAVGLGLGFAATGGEDLLSRLLAFGPPSWPGYGGLVSYWPWLSAGLQPAAEFLASTAIALLLFGALHRLRRGGRSWLGVLLLLLLGIAAAPHGGDTGLVAWLAGAFLTGAAAWVLWLLVRRVGWSMIPTFVGAAVLLSQAEALMERSYPGSVVGAILATVLVSASMVLWSRFLRFPALVGEHDPDESRNARGPGPEEATFRELS